MCICYVSLSLSKKTYLFMSLQDNSETSKISLTWKPESNAEVYVLGFFVGPYQILNYCTDHTHRKPVLLPPQTVSSGLFLLLLRFCILICYHGNLRELAHQILRHYPPVVWLCSGGPQVKRCGEQYFLSKIFTKAWKIICVIKTN